MEVKYCDECRERLHIRLACGDDFKHADNYLAFFRSGGLSEDAIEQYIRHRNFQMRFLELGKVLQVKVDDDTWKIVRNAAKSYSLYHNNYEVLDDGTRLFSKQFHSQCGGKDLNRLFKVICQYSYEKHLEAKKDKELKAKYPGGVPFFVRLGLQLR